MTMAADTVREMASVEHRSSVRRDANYLLDLIGETRPYVSVDHIVADDERVFGVCRREQVRYRETATLSTSEAARIMALQGSLAAAHRNPARRRHYYLAVKGEFLWTPMKDLLPHSEEFLLCAETEGDISARQMVTAIVECRTCHGQLYSTLRCRYLALEEEAFFAAMGGRCDTPRPRGNPYRNPRRHLEGMRYSAGEERTEAWLERCAAADFAGHFDGCPLCPVSILGDNMVALIEGYPDVGNYAVQRLGFWCKRAARAGENLRLACLRKGPADFSLAAEDATGSGLFGMEIRLQEQRENPGRYRNEL